MSNLNLFSALRAAFPPHATAPDALRAVLDGVLSTHTDVRRAAYGAAANTQVSPVDASAATLDTRTAGQRVTCLTAHMTACSALVIASDSSRLWPISWHLAMNSGRFSAVSLKVMNL